MSDAAVASIVTGIVTVLTMVMGFLTLWIKLRYGVGKAEEAVVKVKAVESKIDENTHLTMTGAEKINQNAREAADAASLVARDAASAAAMVANELSQLLNGSLDRRMRAIVKEHSEPLLATFKSHAEQDERNMAEIRQALQSLRATATP